MNPIPLTFFHRAHELPNRAIASYLREFLASDQSNIVLTDGLLSRMENDSSSIAFFRSLLRDLQMSFVDSHAPYGPRNDLCCANESLRPSMLAMHERNLEIAASFGVETMTIHMGKFEDFSIPIRRYRDLALASLERLLPTASRLGVTICIENVWYQTSSAEALLEAIHHFNSPALGICFDIGHAYIMSGKFRDPANRMWGTYPGREPDWNNHLLDDLFPHIVNCHVHDNDGITDQHLIPGYGNIDWSLYFPKILSAPRLRCIQCESAPSFSSPYSIQSAVSALRSLLPPPTAN